MTGTVTWLELKRAAGTSRGHCTAAQACRPLNFGAHRHKLPADWRSPVALRQVGNEYHINNVTSSDLAQVFASHLGQVIVCALLDIKM